jgi:acyl-CoA reductase-like NAD-dependent aldehyde dehydrogenase
MAVVIADSSAVGRSERKARLDGYVQRACDAAAALRRLDQEAVERVVWAMTVAGLEQAVELAELAMEETDLFKSIVAARKLHGQEPRAAAEAENCYSGGR